MFCRGRLGYVGFWRSWFRRFPGDDVREAYRLLDRVGLMDMADKRADELSGGQRQRVGICRALIQNPDLLLVDEPTASLDPKTSRQIMRLINELCEERGLAAIINIHDVLLAQMFSKRIVGLEQGSIVYDGTPEDLTPEVLTRIYGEENWEATIGKVEEEDGRRFDYSRGGVMMDKSGTITYPMTWKKPPYIKNASIRWIIYFLSALYLAAAFGTMDVNWTRIAEGLPRAERFLDAFFPPNFADNRGVVWDGIQESIWMAVISTVAGIMLSVPIGLGAARNLAPKYIYLFNRSIIALSRTFPEIILAIFAVKLFGFGPFAGFIALSIGTIGFYAKLLAEDIENMSESQAEAIKATGATWFQWINYAIQPQVMPRMIGLSVYRLDINFRESAVVGIVGGGGIGATLNTAFDRYEFDTAAAILLIIIGIVMCLEYVSGFLRKRVQ